MDEVDEVNAEIVDGIIRLIQWGFESCLALKPAVAFKFYLLRFTTCLRTFNLITCTFSPTHSTLPLTVKWKFHIVVIIIIIHLVTLSSCSQFHRRFFAYSIFWSIHPPIYPSCIECHLNAKKRNCSSFNRLPSRSCTKISFHGNQVSGSDENSRAKVGSPAIERNKDRNFLCVVSWRVGVSENWQRKRSKARKLNKLKNCTRAETLLAFPFVKGLSALSFHPSIPDNKYNHSCHDSCPVSSTIFFNFKSFILLHPLRIHYPHLCRWYWICDRITGTGSRK